MGVFSKLKPRTHRLLGLLNIFQTNGGLDAKNVNGKDRALVKWAAQTDDPPLAILQSEKDGFVREESMSAQVASISTHTFSVSEIAKNLHVAKAAATQMLHEERRLTKGCFNAVKDEPCAMISALYLSKFFLCCVLDCPSGVFPDQYDFDYGVAISASLERNPLWEFDVALRSALSTSTTWTGSGTDSLAFLSERKELEAMLGVFGEARGHRMVLLEIIAKADQSSEIFSSLQEKLPVFSGGTTAYMTEGNFEGLLLRQLLMVDPQKYSTGYFPNLGEIADRLKNFSEDPNARRFEYRWKWPDEPLFTASQRHSLQKSCELPFAIYRSAKAGADIPFLFPVGRRQEGTAQDPSERFDFDGSRLPNLLFKAITSKSFASRVNRLFTQDALVEAAKIEGGLNTLLPWHEAPFRVRQQLLRVKQNDQFRRRLTAGLALTQFSAEFILTAEENTLEPFLKKLTCCITDSLRAGVVQNLDDDLISYVRFITAERIEHFSKDAARAALLRQLDMTRTKFSAAIGQEGENILKVTNIGLKRLPERAISKNSPLRTFWPEDLAVGGQELFSEFVKFCAKEVNHLPQSSRPLSLEAFSGAPQVSNEMLQGGDRTLSERAEDFVELARSEDFPQFSSDAIEAGVEILAELEEAGFPSDRFLSELPSALAKRITTGSRQGLR